MQKIPYSVIQLILALVGFFVAGLLFFEHRHAIDLPCSGFGGGCDLVNSSRWAHVGPFPVAMLGMLGYALLAVLAISKLTASSARVRLTLSWLVLVVSALGTAFSWYLQYVAAVDIEAFCIYCRTSAIVMTLIFLSALAERVSDTKR